MVVLLQILYVILSIVMPHCATEDSTMCYHQDSNAVAGQDHSFVALADVLIFSDGHTEQIPG